MPAHDERRSHDGRIGIVLLLPGAIAEHGYRRGGNLVVAGRDGASGEGLNTKGTEIVAGDEFAAQGLGKIVALPAAHAELVSGSLKSSQLLELRGPGLESKIERIRIQAPIILGSALYAAVGACANAVEARRIHYRQRLEHHRVNEGEDGGGCA